MGGERGGVRAGLPPRLQVGGLAQDHYNPSGMLEYSRDGQANSTRKKSAEGQCPRETDRMVPEEPSWSGTVGLGSWIGRECSGKCQDSHQEPDKSLIICTWISAFTSRSNLTISWLQIRTWTSWGAAMLETRLRRAAAAKLERVRVGACPPFRTSPNVAPRETRCGANQVVSPDLELFLSCRTRTASLVCSY